MDFSDELRGLLSEMLGIPPARFDALTTELANADCLTGSLPLDLLTDVWSAVMGDAPSGRAEETIRALYGLPIHPESDRLAECEILTFGELIAAHSFDPFPYLESVMVNREAGAWLVAASFRDGVMLFTGPAPDAHAPSLLATTRTMTGAGLTALFRAAEGAPSWNEPDQKHAEIMGNA